MPFRFVHAADIHLDSPLRSLALRDPDLAELIGNATRRALVRIVDLCLEEQVDALLLAGDLYDGDQTSMKTARFLADQIRKLHEAGIRVFVIRGNHDALSRITKELTLPDSVTLFTGRGNAVAIERARGELPVVVHGVSFAEAHAPESLLGKYRPPTEGAVNIGLMHTSLDGSPGHDPYAPCRAADLHAAGFRYWALGHIHMRSMLDGDATIVMPGMPQGRDINEAGPKSVSLVTVRDDRSVLVEERLTSVAQFERVAVDLSEVEDWSGVAGAVRSALECGRTAARSEHLIVRLRLHGETPFAWRMRRDLDLLGTEAASQAAGVGKTMVERVELDCTAPTKAADVEGVDPLTELRRLIGDEILAGEHFRADVTAIAEELRGQLPPECRNLLGDSEAAFAARLGAIMREGAEDVLARLHADDGVEGG